MTPKELLIQELELVPEAVIEDLLDFLLLAKMKLHRQQQQQPQTFASFVEDLVTDIPPQVAETLPTDSAVEHDHYIYGSPKKYETAE